MKYIKLLVLRLLQVLVLAPVIVLLAIPFLAVVFCYWVVCVLGSLWCWADTWNWTDAQWEEYLDAYGHPGELEAFLEKKKKREKHGKKTA